ncbi:hypothetical protein F2Q69_00048860 [Brassica cretica]|uniref:Uncharacterized protein n=1 Tax=Brassica cretica TaxID=69181 RepID=A0A8S9PYF0_BRACR|nr:hypothetical protein F2Q69_00048860 [Brassica cretica]
MLLHFSEQLTLLSGPVSELDWFQKQLTRSQVVIEPKLYDPIIPQMGPPLTMLTLAELNISSSKDIVLDALAELNISSSKDIVLDDFLEFMT